jgi:hypothetical protein
MARRGAALMKEGLFQRRLVIYELDTPPDDGIAAAMRGSGTRGRRGLGDTPVPAEGHSKYALSEALQGVARAAAP